MVASRIYRDEIFLALTRQCREKTANIPCELRPPYLDKFLWELAFMVGVCLRSQAWQMATYRCMPNNLCCPASIKVRESALALDTSPALKTKSKREGRSHGFFFCCFFFLFVIGDSQQNFVQNDSPMVKTMNSPVCEADSNNKLFRFYPMPMILHLMTKDSDRGKLWLPKNGSITNGQSHIQPK